MTAAEPAWRETATSRAYLRAVWLALALGYLALASSGLMLMPAYSDAVVLPRGAGIGIALLLIFGQRRWPLLLLGALLSRLIIYRVTGIGFTAAHLGAALAIAGLEAAQIAAGAALLRRLFGFPIRLRSARDVARAALLAGIVLSIATATLGMAILAGFGMVPRAGLLGNWLAWWIGDMIGVVTAVPIALLWPSRAAPHVYWKGMPLPRFHATALTCVLASLAITIVSWKAVTLLTIGYTRGQFETLVRDNRQALDNRLQAYAFGLDGAKGLMQGSNRVTEPEWSDYVKTLDLPTRLPGMGGIGFVAEVPEAGLDAFQAHAKELGVSGLSVHPDTSQPDRFVIQYIAPRAPNAGILGLDIGFETHRRAAAIAARDSGQMRITRSISLVGYPGTPTGFLALDPLYRTGAPLATVAERSGAFRGWIAAPISATALLSNLTVSQKGNLDIALYDGPTAAPGHLIYRAAGPGPRRRPAYSVTSHMPVFGRTWTIVWQSTPAFENSVNRAAASITLSAGLAFSALLALYLLSLTRREDRISAQVAARTRELAAQIEENRSIIQTPNANIAMMDEKGHLLFTNESFTHLFGYTGPDLLGRPLAALLDGATAEYFAWSRQRSEPTSYRSEVRTTNRTGAAVVLDVQINAWLSVDGARRYTALITDVTEKRQVEQELRHARRRLDIALSGAKIGVFELDLPTGRNIVSTTWKLLLGFKPDVEIDAQAEFIGRLHPDDRHIVEQADGACIEGTAERSISEFRIRVTDGSWHWMRSEAVAGERDANGRAIRLIGAMTDITELVESKEALRSSEERFRSAIEAAPVGMAIIALDGRFLKINDALSALVGRPEGEVRRLPFHQFLHPDDRPRVRDVVAAMLEGTRSSYEDEIRCLHVEGGEVWGKLSLALVRDGEGKPDNFVIQVQNITEQKKVERIKNEFVATVSHELRTPLTSINGSLGLVLNGVAGAVPEKAHTMLSIAHKNCSRLILLVNDILDMEKLSSGKMTFDFVEASVPALVQQSIADTRPFAEQTEVGFALAEPEGDLRCQLDPNRFQQVMANLLSNAVKFSPAGGTVEIATERRGGVVRVSVTDHGQGVPLSFRTKIFSAFSQADSSSTRKKPGTGLGLSISRQIVERMGGTIGFSSEPGAPTTFWFTLPLAGASAAAPEPAPPSDRPRILHVEADRDFAQILAASFGPRADLLHAHNLAETHKLIEAETVDLLILDESGGESDGRRIIELILAGDPTIPIVALTADDTVWTDTHISRTFVKTRTSEQKVVAACLELIRQRRPAAHHAAE
jgi:PAS domain S-box-containing protein